MITKQPLTPFWLVGWAAALSLTWLLPNHYLPWTSFHADAWIAIVLSTAAIAVILRSSAPISWYSLPIIAAALVFVPLTQYYFGLVMLSGTAWIATAFLIGFLLSVLTGGHWEAASPSQLADGLFLAIGFAALVSVGLQLNQWMQWEALQAWSVGSSGSRPAANLSQPNQLATLLLWGLLAAAWGLIRKRIGPWTALLMAIYLLFGLALTGSRSAWIAVVILTGAGVTWRSLWPDKRWPWFVAALGLYFVAAVVSVGWLGQVLLLPSADSLNNIIRLSSDIRPLAWSIFVDAALQRPLFGYGWNQVVLAQFAAALNHPSLHIVFSHSHNLFLDLVLWCGIPIGLLVSVFLAWWVIRRVLLVRRPEEAVLMLFLLVVGNHALWEFPLHYAYFLLPTGLIMGVLDQRLAIRPAFVTGRWAISAICLVAVVLLSLIIRDYSRVEPSYRAQRFEWAHIKTEPVLPPEVMLLTQWREVIRANKFEPTPDMTTKDLDWMRSVIISSASTGAFYKLAGALAMQNRPEEAGLWLMRMCTVIPEAQCTAVAVAWAERAKHDAQFAAVRWPR